jgi:hypothetical protein
MYLRRLVFSSGKIERSFLPVTYKRAAFVELLPISIFNLNSLQGNPWHRYYANKQDGLSKLGPNEFVRTRATSAITFTLNYNYISKIEQAESLIFNAQMRTKCRSSNLKQNRLQTKPHFYLC